MLIIGTSYTLTRRCISLVKLNVDVDVSDVIEEHEGVLFVIKSHSTIHYWVI